MSSPLVIFVAMPGTDMGPHATWKDPQEIAKYLYDPVRQKLQEILGTRVELVIEKEKSSSGDIYASMFGEALDAPVYIADLTGANANVYLELGVRWALRDNVTVVVCQSVEHDLKFNVHASRAIPYNKEPPTLEEARRRIVDSILQGLENDKADSPIRSRLEVVSVPKDRWESLQSEVKRLHEENGDELIAAAESEGTSYKERVALLKRVLDARPTKVAALYMLGATESRAGIYESALTYLSQCVKLSPDHSDAWRELGIVQSKTDHLQMAIDSLGRAVELNPADYDALSSLGGAYRRMARAHMSEFDEQYWTYLRKARDAYYRAREIKDKDTYPRLNLIKLDLLLARGDAQLQAVALDEVRKTELLAGFVAEEEGDKDPWKWLDLAESRAFCGKGDSAVEAAHRAFEAFPAERLPGALTTATKALRDVTNSTPLPSDIMAALTQLITEYERRLQPAR